MFNLLIFTLHHGGGQWCFPKLPGSDIISEDFRLMESSTLLFLSSSSQAREAAKEEQWEGASFQPSRDAAQFAVTLAAISESKDWAHISAWLASWQIDHPSIQRMYNSNVKLQRSCSLWGGEGPEKHLSACGCKLVLAFTALHKQNTVNIKV